MSFLRITASIIIGLSGGCFVACSQERNQPIVAGQVIDTVWCDQNPAQSYSLYLPKKYNRKFNMPVVFFYEPGARGRLPVSLYSSVAEKYQCMLVCSNNSRNGPFTVVQEAEDAILQDVSTKFPIANDKLFVCGLSGGARSAVHLARRKKIYAGIIACGAAFPPADKLTNTDHVSFIELIGIEDFNLIEAFSTKEYLAQMKYPHSLVLFQGGHEWPPSEVFDQAIFWQLSKPVESGKFILTDSVRNMHEMNVRSKLQSELDSGDVYIAYLNAVEARQFASQSFKIDSIEKNIAQNPLKEKQQKEFSKLLVMEAALDKQFYTDFFQLKRSASDTVFKEADWRRIISGVKKLGRSDNRMEAHMGARAFQNMQITCFEEYRGQWQDQDYFHASLSARLLTLLNNDDWSYYLLAKTHAARGMKREAMQALTKSAALGLNDKSLIENEKAFDILASEKKFKEVMLQVESNAKKVKN